MTITRAELLHWKMRFEQALIENERRPADMPPLTWLEAADLLDGNDKIKQQIVYRGFLLMHVLDSVMMAYRIRAMQLKKCQANYGVLGVLAVLGAEYGNKTN